MQRVATAPRPNWQQTVESQGLHYHTHEDGRPYWDETAFYRFTAAQVDQLERATYALDEMCLQAVQHVIDEDLLDDLEIPAQFHDYVRQSWERDEVTAYGRFDLAYDGRSPPKLLEYNADTPTALLEAAVVQWFWFREQYPATESRAFDQFNSIHEKLIEAWRVIKSGLDAWRGAGAATVHFSAVAGHLEDFMTVNYLRDTAVQAGLTTEYIDVERIGWNAGRRQFLDERERPMPLVFKLYPWEWMLREPFAQHLPVAAESTRWLEAPWKAILSNKGILPILYDLFPDSPYLLPTSYEPLPDRPYIRKPFFGREGANVQTVADGRVVNETDGEYGGPYVYQALHPIPRFDGFYPVIGSWMVNGHACGIGIREDETPVTRNTSRFVPHVFAR